MGHGAAITQQDLKHTILVEQRICIRSPGLVVPSKLSATYIQNHQRAQNLVLQDCGAAWSFYKGIIPLQGLHVKVYRASKRISRIGTGSKQGLTCVIPVLLYMPTGSF